MGSDIAKQGFKLRAEIVERWFAHVLDRGSMRCTHLRRRENVHKRYLLHVAGHNLSLLMRQIIGSGTPKEAASTGKAVLLLISAPGGPSGRALPSTSSTGSFLPLFECFYRARPL